jgi:hypothetical protein
VQGNPERPIRIVVESISSRRREALADVEASEDEVEELGDEEDVVSPRTACVEVESAGLDERQISRRR